MATTWQDVGKALPDGLKLLGTVLTATGVGAPVGAAIAGVGALLAHALGSDASPDAVLTAIQTDPAAAEKLAEFQGNNKVQLQQIVLQTHIADLAAQSAEIQAVVDSQKDARARDEVIRKAGQTNTRADLMLGGAYIAVIVIIVALVFGRIDAGGAIFALLLMLATKFASNIGTAFDFEFGSSRGTLDQTSASTAIVAQAQGGAR